MKYQNKSKLIGSIEYRNLMQMDSFDGGISLLTCLLLTCDLPVYFPAIIKHKYIKVHRKNELKNTEINNEIKINNTFIQTDIDNLTLNLIKHKKVCIGKSFDACPMQTNSKNLEGFLVT